MRTGLQEKGYHHKSRVPLAFMVGGVACPREAAYPSLPRWLPLMSMGGIHMVPVGDGGLQVAHALHGGRVFYSACFTPLHTLTVVACRSHAASHILW